MIDLCLAHVAARGRFIDDHSLGAEGFDQCLDRRLAAEVHHGAGPIENDQIEAVLEAHAAAPVSTPDRSVYGPQYTGAQPSASTAKKRASSGCNTQAA